ncbi:MAG TPA: bacterial transcriptional activator domain-containing protein, partial [Thermoanaerobaculia bacterium]|nr:bacterial transcriptional activator domain-containing protein [Thermoanaerobaculia bacterium]
GRRIERALDLYRGDLFHDESAGDWLPDAADRLRRLYAEGLSTLADIRQEEQELEAASEILTRLVWVDTLREEAYRRLMNVLARTGRRDEALRHYARLTALLQRELDAEPEPETQQLADRLRSGSQE